MNLLKKFRVKAGMTQTGLAEKVGVTQPNYQRWEAGNAPIPDEKLKKLAKVLKTTPETLLGRYAPIDAAFYDDTAPEDLQYYGEVAIHFKGVGEPLLLSISEEVHGDLFRELQEGHKFITAKSLANQTVVIRTAAISDLYFSSEAYDDFGPEHGTYKHIQLQLPDPRDWEIVEALDCDGDVDEFDPAAVERIEKMLEITTDEEFKRLVDEGRIKAEDVEKARAKENAAVDRIFKLARDVVYQLSSGRKRHISVYDDEDVYNAFWEMVGNYDDGDRIIVFQAEGYHRTAFINKNALDYVSIPTHKYEAGELEASAKEIEFFGDDGHEPSKGKSKGRRKKSENVVDIAAHRPNKPQTTETDR
jgi:transcriptional regulator with XRE-family HTH domain